jgi:hypothetical protein
MDVNLEERVAETVVHTYSAGEVTTYFRRAVRVSSGVSDLIRGAEAGQ